MKPLPTIPLLVLVAGLLAMTAAAAEPGRPNFLVIVADDLGWSDVGFLGGEIRTPVLDELAATGVVMPQFYVSPICAPTRAMLMTGVDNHPAGLGTMPAARRPHQAQSINYGLQLHDGVVTVAEALAASGYDTMMAAKWHIARDRDQYPDRRGFARSFALLQGGASHFADRLPLHPGNPVEYVEDGEPAELPEDFYSTTYYASKLIEYLDARDRDRPFFAWLGFTAPHDPLQVPDDWLDRYRGAYDAGPERIRLERLARIRDLGLWPEQAPAWNPASFPPLKANAPEPWDERGESQRRRDARSMEIYAAMVELMDQEIGRVLDHLEQQGALDDTFVMFLSDNGASAMNPLMYPNATAQWYRSERSQELDALGRPGSHAYQGVEWAIVSNTPLRLFKTMVAEGGIRSPFVVRGPGLPAGRRSPGIGHVTDIAATLYELAGVDTDGPPFAGRHPIQGRSLASAWRLADAPAVRFIGTEFNGGRALLAGDWKITRLPGAPGWSLFNVTEDPGETQDLAQRYPERLEALVDAYQAYAADNGIIDPELPDAGAGRP